MLLGANRKYQGNQVGLLAKPWKERVLSGRKLCWFLPAAFPCQSLSEKCLVNGASLLNTFFGTWPMFEGGKSR